MIYFNYISCTGWIGSSVDDQRKEYDRHDVNHDSCNYARCAGARSELKHIIKGRKRNKLGFL